MLIWDDLPTDRLLVDLSLWSADLSALGADIHRMNAWVDLFHLDVSDAHFVPGLLFFPDLVAALRPLTRRPFHVHLMADQPDALVEPFLSAGADVITVHVENGDAGRRAIAQVRQAGKTAGIALSLDLPVESVIPYLDRVGLVLMMGTRLGIKGQGLAPKALERVRCMRRLIASRGLTGRVKIFADGGIRQQTAPGLRLAGADGIVPGSLVFGSPNLEETIAWIRSLPLESMDG
jgi:ribulose-phosphate 3-epimerase